jgi:hypothetical protein
MIPIAGSAYTYVIPHGRVVGLDHWMGSRARVCRGGVDGIHQLVPYDVACSTIFGIVLPPSWCFTVAAMVLPNGQTIHGLQTFPRY